MAYTNIKKSSDYFNTKLYTGTGATQSITTEFQPDFTWIKTRSNIEGHELYDAVRGATKMISSNSSNAETTKSTALTSFNSDGFTLGNNFEVNASGRTFASWNWKANGTGVANTDGTITSTVSANTTAGFSIATWSGTGSNGSIGHGLGGVDCMIIKNTNSVRDFYFWQKTMAYNTRLEMNNTETFTTGTDNMTALPDATKINMATSTQNNGSSQNYVGYFFQEKQGFSKFGNYIGNSSTNGTFVYTGFKPAFLLIKNTSADQSWWMWDNKRIGYNGGGNHRFRTNGSDAEFADSTSKVDLLSNGFKWRDGDNAYNFSGNNFIYMCFAEQPLVGDNPATAR